MDLEESSPIKRGPADDVAYTTETSTSSDDSSMEDDGAGTTSNAGAQDMSQFPQVGRISIPLLLPQSPLTT